MPKFAVYRFELKCKSTKSSEANLPGKMEDPNSRKVLLAYAEIAFGIAWSRKSTRNCSQEDSNALRTLIIHASTNKQQHVKHGNKQSRTTSYLLQQVQIGKPKYIATSPGLTALLNVCTCKTAIRRKNDDALPARIVPDIACGVIKSKNK